MCVCVFRCVCVPVCLHGKGSLFKVSISYLESTCDKMVDEKKWCEKRERALRKRDREGTREREKDSVKHTETKEWGKRESESERKRKRERA